MKSAPLDRRWEIPVVKVRLPSFGRLLAAFALLAFAHGAPLQAAERVALVVGNGAYEHVAKLKNPANDARDLSARLEALGFVVIGGVDLDRQKLVEALIRFGRAAEKADTALFFYAGHGLQVNGQNYLVPTDARVEFAAEIDISLVSLSGVMQQLERGSRVNLVFLDACRDNPFAKDLAGSSRSAVALGRGLGRVQTGSGTFIAFATQPDAVATDGAGRNSPFTAALLRHIQTPGLSISDLMVQVRNEVMSATNGAQVPWDSSSLTDRFFFTPPAAEAAQPVATASSADAEKEAYEQAVAVGSCGALEAFRRRFPDSFYAELAAERAQAACAKADAQVAAAPPATVLRAVRAPARDGVCEPGPFDVTYCASSVLDPIKNNRYDPRMLFDGDRATAWVEAEKEDGVGETITLHFGRERALTGFEIINGYDKDQKTWSNNSRLRTLEASTAEGEALAIRLEDVRGASRVDFGREIRTPWLELRIKEVFPGARFRDTAVSELHPIFAD